MRLIELTDLSSLEVIIRAPVTAIFKSAFPSTRTRNPGVWSRQLGCLDSLESEEHSKPEHQIPETLFKSHCWLQAGAAGDSGVQKWSGVWITEAKCP